MKVTFSLCTFAQLTQILLLLDPHGPELESYCGCRACDVAEDDDDGLSDGLDLGPGDAVDAGVGAGAEGIEVLDAAVVAAGMVDAEGGEVAEKVGVLVVVQGRSL